ncbi:MAG: hypothetical protein KIH65_005150 [Candidatus Uhrbacteria bacterium]|nr:hypothetical protein [Candidatus Uhrbacteria bacterium]
MMSFLLIILAILDIETVRSLENGWRKFLIFFPVTLTCATLCMMSFFLAPSTEMMSCSMAFLVCRTVLVILILTELINLWLLYKYT